MAKKSIRPAPARNVPAVTSARTPEQKAPRTGATRPTPAPRAPAGSPLPSAAAMPKPARVSLKTEALGGARFAPVALNPTLARVETIPAEKKGTWPKLIAHPPYVSITDVSIQATCTDACPLKGNGCYVTSGRMAARAAKLDEAALGRSGDQVIANEAFLLDDAFGGGPVPQDGAKGGRDLRLHVGGDVSSEFGARVLAGAAERWRGRGGGEVWIYTHRWREISREAFGNTLHVLASVEVPEDIEVARKAGYAAAIVMDKFPSHRAFHLPGTTAKIIPCPLETQKIPCVECRLCLGPDLLALNAAIGFTARGAGARKVRETLVQLRVPKRD